MFLFQFGGGMGRGSDSYDDGYSANGNNVGGFSGGGGDEEEAWDWSAWPLGAWADITRW